MAQAFKETAHLKTDQKAFEEGWERIFGTKEAQSSATQRVNMDFSDALKACKSGAKISREGWNGKNQFVVFQKGYPEGIAINKNTSEALSLPEGTVVCFEPYLMIKNAQDKCVPWLASQGDLLANDWLATPV